MPAGSAAAILSVPATLFEEGSLGLKSLLRSTYTRLELKVHAVPSELDERQRERLLRYFTEKAMNERVRTVYFDGEWDAEQKAAAEAKAEAERRTQEEKDRKDREKAEFEAKQKAADEAEEKLATEMGFTPIAKTSDGSLRPMTWEDASIFCEGQNLRLPSIYELVKLAQARGARPLNAFAVDETYESIEIYGHFYYYSSKGYVPSAPGSRIWSDHRGDYIGADGRIYRDYHEHSVRCIGRR
jgi:hypothetical protein